MLDRRATGHGEGTLPRQDALPTIVVLAAADFPHLYDASRRLLTLMSVYNRALSQYECRSGIRPSATVMGLHPDQRRVPRKLVGPACPSAPRPSRRLPRALKHDGPSIVHHLLTNISDLQTVLWSRVRCSAEGTSSGRSGLYESCRLLKFEFHSRVRTCKLTRGTPMADKAVALATEIRAKALLLRFAYIRSWGAVICAATFLVAGPLVASMAQAEGAPLTDEIGRLFVACGIASLVLAALGMRDASSLKNELRSLAELDSRQAEQVGALRGLLRSVNGAKPAGRRPELAA